MSVCGLPQGVIIFNLQTCNKDFLEIRIINKDFIQNRLITKNTFRRNSAFVTYNTIKLLTSIYGMSRATRTIVNLSSYLLLNALCSSCEGFILNIIEASCHLM
jgi:hypothetical protein